MLTFLLEVPVVLMIVNGSDALCGVVGRKRYQLIMGLVPLSNAIAGSAGLQASAMTTRAIVRGLVTTDSYSSWFCSEFGVAVYLALMMSFLVGFVSLLGTGFDIMFSVTMLLAQFLSILIAGCSGTCAPFLYSFVGGHNSCWWLEPIQASLQDIVGTLSMVVVSYYILLWTWPYSVEPEDSCFTVDANIA